MGGERSSLILEACKSRKMGPSFKAKSEGSQVRGGVWMSKITIKRSKKTHGRSWDTVLDWNSAPWSVRHPTREGHYCKTKCSVAKAGCEAWILLIQLCPNPAVWGSLSDCQVLTLSRVPSAPFQSSPIKTNSPGGTHLIIFFVSLQSMAIYREI